MNAAQRSLAGSLAVAAAAFALAPAGPAFAVRAPPGVRALANTDSRRPFAPPSLPAAGRSARKQLARSLGAQGIVATDRTTGSTRLVARRDGFLTPASGADPRDIALEYVRARDDVFGLDDADLAALRLTSRYRSPDGVTHLAWTQTAAGIDAYDNVLFANVARDGRIVNVGGSAVPDLAVATVDPAVGAARAVSVARGDVGGTITAPRATQAPGATRATRFSNGDRARLAIFSDGRRERLAWRAEVTGKDDIHYELVVDAANERLLLRRSLTEFASNADVHENYPGAPGGGTTATVNLAADPSWLDRSGGQARLAGNNAHAYADTGGGDGVDPGEDVPASGATDWQYPRTLFAVGGQSCPSLGGAPACSWDPGSDGSMSTNRNQATTQLFYLVNRFHDHLAAAPIGFTHGARNFEFADADGPGTGQGGDPVLAEANDSSGTDNANMYTPTDGASPVMQMYFWSNPATNSSDAADVVFHEFTHGLTNRSVGTGGGLSSAQSRAMGEGWSDWYALDYLVGNGYRADSATPGELKLADYLLPPAGIREQAMDCPVGATAPACPGTSGAGPGGYTLGDMGNVIGYFQYHADGEIWSQTLWDLRRALGATTARALVTGGLRLSPNNPSFLDMRDAIIQADQVLGGANYDTLWSLFAVRGMGYSATTPGAHSGSSVEAFDVPPVLTQESVTVTDPAPGGDGDGIAEPGETLRVDEVLRNPWHDPVSGVSGALTTTTPGVTVTPASATWPDFAGGASHPASAPFSVAIAQAHQCGRAVALKLTYTTDQGGGTIPLTIPTGTPASSAPSADVPQPIRSGSAFDSKLTFAAGGAVQDLEVHIPRLTHTWVGDLRISLTSPAGTQVVLMNSPGSGGGGSSGADFTDLVLSDSATTPIESLPGTAPAGGFTGRYRPDQPLSVLDGEDRAGTWKLRVEDMFGGDEGVLQAWGLAPVGRESCTTGGGNGAPVAADDARSVDSEHTLHGSSVLANDSDPDGDALTAVKETEPAHGTVDLASDGTFTYIPTGAFEGTDFFSYRAHDDATSSRIATVKITVLPRPNVAPVAVADSYSLRAGETLSGASVLANDSDADGDALTAELESSPSRGSLSLASDGTFTYTPHASFTGGQDQFSYRADDGRTSTPASVTLTVTAQPDAPVVADDEYGVAPGQVLHGSTVLANDSDPNGDPLTAVLASSPAGSLVLAPDGTFTYTPNSGFEGNDHFSYRASDGTHDSPLAQVKIVVRRPNSAPAVVADGYSLGAGTTLYGSSVLANDSDADGDQMTARTEAYPLHGSLSMQSDGTFTYRPYDDFSGVDSFSYRAEDGRSTSALATVTLTVRPANRAPIAADDRFSVMAGGSMTAWVLSNDVDYDGDQLSAWPALAPSNGSLYLGADGRFEYRPNPGFAGIDSFSYRASDGTAMSAAAFVTIVVEPALTLPASAWPPSFWTLPRPSPRPVRSAAALQVRRAAVSDGRLDVLAKINAGATGAATLSFRARGVTTVARVPIAGGQIRLTRALARKQRSASGGILKVVYPGSDRVVPDDVTLRAAPRRARLRLRDARIASGRLLMSGTVARGVRGAVHVRLDFGPTADADGRLRYSAPIKDGAWSLQGALPPVVVAAGGRISLQFNGDGDRGIRGEQLLTRVAPGR